MPTQRKARMQFAAILAAMAIFPSAYSANSGPLKHSTEHRPKSDIQREKSRSSVATILIDKSVPRAVGIVTAPDTDPDHYETLSGTHYSYRCESSYVLPSKDTAIEVCEISPVALKIKHWPETEIINIIDGEVIISEADGGEKIYKTGDTFVLPQGFTGVWRQTGKLTKLIVRQPLYWKD